LVQVTKKEICKTIEITSVEPEIKYIGKEEEINNCIETMRKDREEFNVIITPNKKNLKDNEIVSFPKLIKDGESKIKMVCEGEKKEEFEAAFSGGLIIKIPTEVKVVKK
jgi:hypothetical protein